MSAVSQTLLADKNSSKLSCLILSHHFSLAGRGESVTQLGKKEETSFLSQSMEK